MISSLEMEKSSEENTINIDLLEKSNCNLLYY